MNYETILSVIVTAILAPIITALVMRSKTGAEVKKMEAEEASIVVAMATSAAKDLIDQYRYQLDVYHEKLDDLQTEFSDYRNETDENMTRLTLALSIALRLLKVNGIAPPFRVRDLSTISLTELRQRLDALES